MEELKIKIEDYKWIRDKYVKCADWQKFISGILNHEVSNVFLYN